MIIILIATIISFNLYAADCIDDKLCQVVVRKGGIDSFKTSRDTKLEAELWVADNLKKLKHKAHRNSFGLMDRWLLEEKEGYTNTRVITHVTEAVPEHIDELSGELIPEVPEIIAEHTEYFYPKDYFVIFSDISAEVQTTKDAEAADKTERTAIRGMLNNINSSELPLWHKRILRQYVKDMRE